ncbi:MAG: prephenate dehydrogenase [Clostridium sp.]|jgi:prephenate dehydrogenase|nr:prephenate dehydrogenase [Clostridium sp.]
MSFFTCGFVGLGLIGGSIAKALKQNIPGIRIVAHDVNQTALQAALSEQVIDQALPAVGEGFSSCDYLFLSAPAPKNAENLTRLKKYLSPNCLLTDVGSVKADIHRHVEALGLSGQFIGGHPMAGSERCGYQNSKAVLLENAYYILTPTDRTPPEKTAAYRELVLKIKALPLILTQAEHDYATAAVSHLPHIIAASLVNLVRDSDTKEELMKLIAAGGFKDITRIASSSASMWEQICLTNAEHISALLGHYMETLASIKEQLERRQSQELYWLFDSARVYRESFLDVSSGPIKTSYSLSVDIADEPGALASIATILALNQISIKNIGITHNREAEEGVLLIEFYEKEAMEKAGYILRAKGYRLYGRK